MKTNFSLKTRLGLLFAILLLSVMGVPAQNAALHFDGVNDNMQTAHAANLPRVYNFERTSSFSYELWIKPETGGSLWGNICAIPQQNGNGHTLSLDPSYFLEMRLIHNLNTGNGIVVRSQTAVPNDGKWHHVAMSYNGSSDAAGIKLYIDGSLVAHNTEMNSLTGTLAVGGRGCVAGIKIDALSRAHEAYRGAMDDLRVWNKAISQAEVASRMNNELAGNEANLVFYADFNQGNPGQNNAGITLTGKPDPRYYPVLFNFALTGTTSNFIGVQTVCTRQ